MTLNLPQERMDDRALTEFIVEHFGWFSLEHERAVLDQMLHEGWSLGMALDGGNEFWPPRRPEAVA